MTLNRWWHAAVLAMAAGLLVLLLSVAEPGRLPLGLAAVALFVVAWAVLSRRAIDGNREAVILSAAIIVAAGLGTAAYPGFAMVQCIAFPLMWLLASSMRTAIIANVALAATVGLGFLLSREMGPAELPSVAATVALTLVFSLAMGFWISRIVEASEERQALLDELKAAQAQLAAAHRESGTIAERERLTREIHDTIAQDLTGLVMLAERARREPDAAARDRQLAQLEEAAREALDETRSLVAAGAPASLDGGISAALHRLGARFGRDSGIEVSVEVLLGAAAERTLDRDSEVVVLRCAQEALANVRKHSRASRAWVVLDAAATGDTTLSIRDDGIGFDAALGDDNGGVGLSGMRDRLALAGGRLELASGASGTTLRITLAEATP